MLTAKTKEEFLANLERLDRNELVTGAYQFFQLPLPRNCSKTNAIRKIKAQYDHRQRDERKRELRLKAEVHGVKEGYVLPSVFYGKLSKGEARKWRKYFRSCGRGDLAGAKRVEQTIPY